MHFWCPDLKATSTLPAPPSHLCETFAYSGPLVLWQSWYSPGCCGLPSARLATSQFFADSLHLVISREDWGVGMCGGPCPLCGSFIIGWKAESKTPSQETHAASDFIAFWTSLDWSCGIWIHQGAALLLFGVTWWWFDSPEGKPSLGCWCCLGKCSRYLAGPSRRPSLPRIHLVKWRYLVR